jgi:uncharacterized protein YlxP (DUF503 family)
MVVGVCRVVLALPFNDSLKGKRAVVKSILDRARVKFHVAAAEVGDLDVHKRAVLGFAAVSNESRHLQSLLDKLVSFVAAASEAQLLDKSTNIEPYDAALGVMLGNEDHWHPPEWDEKDDDDGDDQK